MNIVVGLAQMPNSADLDKNFALIIRLLDQFELAKVNLVLFPECSLSGFTSKMREYSLELLTPYFMQIQKWVEKTGIEVVLPTAIVLNKKVYNSGRWFKSDQYIEFYKIGLTESEKNFFSIPESHCQKVIESQGFKFAILICFEAQHPAWTYFKPGEVDAILWPGYWGWTLESQWSEEIEPDKKNLIYSNILDWKVPVLQSNFSVNDLQGHSGAGPEGLSCVIDSNNQPVSRGPHKQCGGLIVKLEKKADKIEVLTPVKSFTLVDL